MSDFDEILDRIGDLAEAMDRLSLAEVEVDDGDLHLRVRRDVTAQEQSSRARPIDGQQDADLVFVRSPIVGTFYRAPEPEAPPFVEPGSTVTKGQVLCIIEAMKLMNEIDAEQSGTIESIFVESGQPVEYGQKLFAIRLA